MTAAVFIAALGGVVHNALSLPLPLLAPETTLPALVYALLWGWMLVSRGATMARTSLLAWAILNLIGGGVLSVLPLPIWPFTPEQNVDHYIAHAIYALSQLPLIVVIGPRPTAATRTSR